MAKLHKRGGNYGGGRPPSGKPWRKTVSFSLQPYLLTALDNEASKQNISRSQALEGILEAWLAPQPKQEDTGPVTPDKRTETPMLPNAEEIIAMSEAAHDFNPDAIPAMPDTVTEYKNQLTKAAKRVHDNSEFKKMRNPGGTNEVKRIFQSDKTRQLLRIRGEFAILAAMIARNVLHVDLEMYARLSEEKQREMLWTVTHEWLIENA